MAVKRSNTLETVKRKRKGVHAKSKTSRSKNAKNYVKKYRGQGDKLPTTIDYDHVKLILDESEKHGLKHKVEESIKVYLSKNKMSFIESYQRAFQDWVK